MAASGGYEVTFSELEKAAAAYKAQGAVVQKALSQFEGVANLPASAFGNLPASAQMATEYSKFFTEVTQDLAKLATTLLQGSAKLTQSAANYKAAETASTAS